MTTNPKDVKSQHELSTTNDGKRSSDVLLSTIEELEKTKEENKFIKTKLALYDMLTDHYEKIVAEQDEELKMAKLFFIIIFVCGCISALLEFWK